MSSTAFHRFYPITKDVENLNELSIPRSAEHYLSENYDDSYAYSSLSNLRQFLVAQRDKYCPVTSYAAETRCSRYLVDAAGFLGFNSLALGRKLADFKQIILCEENKEFLNAAHHILSNYKLISTAQPSSSYIIVKPYSFYKYIEEKKFDQQSNAAVIYWDLACAVSNAHQLLLDSAAIDYDFSPPLQFRSENREFATLSSFLSYLFSSATSCCMLLLKLPANFNTEKLLSIAKFATENTQISPHYKFLALCGKITKLAANEHREGGISSAESKNNAIINVYNDPSVVPAASYYQLQTLASFSVPESPNSHLFQRLKQILSSQLYGLPDEQNQLIAEFLRITQLQRSTPQDPANLLPEVRQFANFLNDEEIYDALRLYFHSTLGNLPSVKAQKQKDSAQSEGCNGRANSRVAEIVKLIAECSQIPTNVKDLGPNYRILDVGCSEGAITAAVGAHLRLEGNQIHGCDVRPMPAAKGFTFSLISGLNLPYKAEQFDCVLALMALHHIETVENTLQEIWRVLKPNGLLIVREHDNFTPKLAILIDVMHGLYARTWADPPEQPTFCDNYYANYRERSAWSSLIQQQGFLQAKDSPDSEKHYRRPWLQSADPNKPFIRNPFAFYYGAYIKNSSANNGEHSNTKTNTAAQKRGNESNTIPSNNSTASIKNLEQFNKKQKT
jgi:ubiquinone/menaquinone biosynthesis C-methylase UbiE